MKIIRQITFFVSCFLLIGCNLTQPNALTANPYEGQTASQLFKQGEQSMVDGDFHAATQRFEALDSQYPFSQFHRQMLLNLIYAYYRQGDTASSAVTANRYSHLYPRGPNTDYAFYMKGLANFSIQKGGLARFFKVDPAARDLGNAIEAYNDFSLFVRRYPKSPYVGDARQRMIYLRNTFAEKEMQAGLYYYRHKAYVAAANRASFIVHTYPQAPTAKQAMILLVKANQALGLEKQAKAAELVLRHNYPDASLSLTFT